MEFLNFSQLNNTIRFVIETDWMASQRTDNNMRLRLQITTISKFELWLYEEYSLVDFISCACNNEAHTYTYFVKEHRNCIYWKCYSQNIHMKIRINILCAFRLTNIWTMKYLREGKKMNFCMKTKLNQIVYESTNNILFNVSIVECTRQGKKTPYSINFIRMFWVHWMTARVRPLFAYKYVQPLRLCANEQN